MIDTSVKFDLKNGKLFSDLLSKHFFIAFIILLSTSCQKKPEEVLVALQPIGIKDQRSLDTISSSIKKYYGFKVCTLKPIEVPDNFWVRKDRFRADSMIRYLRNIKPDSVDYIMGVTSLDISSTKKDSKGEIKKPASRYKDWGIFGLGYRPGASCIVSAYRLSTGDKRKKTERLIKVALHELGHNLSLPHCPNEKCFMRNANESIRTIDEESSELCEECKRKINYQR